MNEPKRTEYVPNPDSLQNQGIEIGKSKSYFGQMKHTNITLFNILKKLGDGRLADGYNTYVKENEEIRKDFLFLYSRLESQRNITAFCRSAGISKKVFRGWGIRLIGSDMVKYETIKEIKKTIIKIDKFIHGTF